MNLRTIICSTLVACSSGNIFASSTQWTHEALTNIMHVQDSDIDAYFESIEGYFTQEAFMNYKQSFNKTNTPLIRELKLNMTSEPLSKIKQNPDNDSEFSGDYSILFNSDDLSLKQELHVTVRLSESQAEPKISQLKFSKLNDAAIKMKSAELMAKCRIKNK